MSQEASAIPGSVTEKALRAGFSSPDPAARASGATLIELVLALSVVAILGMAAVSAVSDTGLQATRGAALRLARDIRFAQRLSMDRLGGSGVTFDVAGQRYMVTENGSPSDAVRDPSTQGDFVRFLDRDEYRGVRLTGLLFAGSSTLSFDVDGVPAHGGSVFLQGPGNRTMTVTVVGGSGLVRLFPP